MKRFLCLLLSVALGLSAFGCDSNDRDSSSTDTGVVLKLNKKTMNLEVGESKNIEIKEFTVDGEDGDVDELTYEVEDEEIATLDGNEITGVSEGQTTVTVSYEDAIANVTINVVESEESSSSEEDSSEEENSGSEPVVLLTLKSTQIDLPLNDTYTVEVQSFTVDGENGNLSLLNYQTANGTIVSVSDNVITGLAIGTTTVTVSYQDTSVELAVNVVASDYVAASDVEALNENAMIYHGRLYTKNDALWIDAGNAGVEIKFYGTELKVKMQAEPTVRDRDGVTGLTHYVYARIFIDGDTTGTRKKLTKTGEYEYTLASGLDYGVHTVKFLKATESYLYTAGSTSIVLKEILTGENCKIVKPDDISNRLKIDFYGDSITSGAGAMGVSKPDSSVSDNLWTTNSDATYTYAAITGRTLNAMTTCTSYSGIAVKEEPNLGSNHNGGMNMCKVWRYYSMANQTYCNIDSDTDVVVINLGTNDAGVSGYTEDQVKTDALELLNDMKTYYSSSTKFVWCYGLMGVNTTIENGIKAAIAEMGSKYSYLQLTRAATTGALGHPSKAAHETGATELTTYLKTLLGIQ